ncbi:nicotinate-nucleotide--dimethylbenzimidazole phosphoribosyltransferase, partial [Mesorhizobium sp.]|uniref:nicotinate-nucleotide--dimethylbenzimidazole phosphoribosyltransferase n=1 Tax=Mesorhizobium sp. TaxID=1871066 RepID=UPI0025D46DA4
GRDVPKLDHVKVFVFAGNHGVTAQGVSAYPSEVTVQMVANFAGGGAAINQLARIAGAKLDVIPLDLDHPTGDFTQVPAMDEQAFLAAVSAGYAAVTKELDLVCFGEMGIGNTTPAAAISTALFGGGAEKWTGRGTGVDDAGLKRHADSLSDPLKIAAALGGRELAAIFGATLAARKNNVPVLLDGFVCTAAAAPLARLHPTGLAHTIAAHVSAEA